MMTVPANSDSAVAALAAGVTAPASSLCWRVFVSDKLGRTWAPVITAADALEVKRKTLAIYRGGTVLEFERLHPDTHINDGQWFGRETA